ANYPESGGLEVLSILLEILDMGFVHVDAGTPQDMYVWPYFAYVPLKELTPAQKVELFKIVTGSDYRAMQDFGAYIFYRLGIAPDGTWHFFVSGEGGSPGCAPLGYNLWGPGVSFHLSFPAKAGHTAHGDLSVCERAVITGSAGFGGDDEGGYASNGSSYAFGYEFRSQWRANLTARSGSQDYESRMLAQQSLITELEDAIGGGSADRRLDTLRRVCDLFETGASMYSDEQVELFDDVIGRLAASIEAKARTELSNRLAPI